MTKIERLQKKYPRFVYQDYDFGYQEGDFLISFDFKIPPHISFNPRIRINNLEKIELEKEVLSNLVFHLGLAEIPSYWKPTCSPLIEVKAGFLSPAQISWWKDLIMEGMGEFFYQNKINFKKPDFLKIVSSKESKPGPVFEGNLDNRVLVPIGEGKDSVLTLELLKSKKKNIRCFSLNPTPPAQKIMNTGNCSNPILLNRNIDQNLLELNRKGFLNGHTPFSSYLAFLGVLIGVIFNFKYIAFSNERSANQGNIEYLGEIINHQYSKTYSFEKKFRQYSQKYLAQKIEYFSFLRPLYEIQIAKLFSKYSKYFSSFISCNEAFKTASGTKEPEQKWCKQCPKCLFVFTILYPFLDKSVLVSIFGENLFEKRDLLDTMLQLTGEKGFKPLECVGTIQENLGAFYLSLKKAETQKEKPLLLRYFEQKVLPHHKDLKAQTKKLLKAWNQDHFLDQKFRDLLIEQKQKALG